MSQDDPLGGITLLWYGNSNAQLKCCGITSIRDVSVKPKHLIFDELQARTESHYINYAELKADDFNGYFIDRAKNLLSLIEKAMNKPVTDRDAENTLDQFGASLA